MFWAYTARSRCLETKLEGRNGKDREKRQGPKDWEIFEGQSVLTQTWSLQPSCESQSPISAWCYRKLRHRLEQIRSDIEAITPNMNAKKRLMIEQIIRTEGMISLIEMYLKKCGIVKPDKFRRGVVDLQPSLATSYLALLNTQRHAVLALGLNKEKAEEVLTPFQIVEQEKRKKETSG